MLFHFYLETREMYWIDSHLMCAIKKGKAGGVVQDSSYCL